MSYETKQANRLEKCVHTALRALKHSIFLLTFLFLFQSAGFCQLTTADIIGTVTDATGAVVPNANVSLTNLGTNEKRNTQTNGSGDYSLTFFRSGTTLSLSKQVASRHRSPRTSQWKQATALATTSRFTPVQKPPSSK